MNVQSSSVSVVAVAAEPPAALLSDQLAVTVKLLRLAKSRLLPDASGIDGAAFPLLFHLVCGPLRVSNLAELVHSDVSTVSRQVSGLTQRGLVAKTGDPGDRRAFQVSLTEQGRATVTERVERRRALFAEVMQDWSPDDIALFTQLLERFCEDLEALASSTR